MTEHDQTEVQKHEFASSQSEICTLEHDQTEVQKHKFASSQSEICTNCEALKKPNRFALHKRNWCFECMYEFHKDMILSHHTLLNISQVNKARWKKKEC